jgi:hypothetical protein
MRDANFPQWVMDFRLSSSPFDWNSLNEIPEAIKTNGNDQNHEK